MRVTPPSGAATERDVSAGAMHHLTAGSNETVEVVSGFHTRAILFSAEVRAPDLTRRTRNLRMRGFEDVRI